MTAMDPPMPLSARPDYALPDEMTLAHAAQVREALLQAMDGGQTEFDARAVSAIDSSGIQLLLALQHSLQGKQAALTLTAPSVALRQALQWYGLDALCCAPLNAA